MVNELLLYYAIILKHRNFSSVSVRNEDVSVKTYEWYVVDHI